MDRMQTHEMISALADGQLRGEAFARSMELIGGDAAALQTWHTYHLIGEVLRSGECSAGMMPAAFLAQVQSRLQHERRAGEPELAEAPQLPPAALPRRRPAANDANFRWKVVAGFSSLTAIAALGWTMTVAPAGKSEDGQIAATGAAVVARSQRPAMIRDPKLDEFLAVHRQLGGASALQMPAGFLRSANYEGPAR